MKPDGISLDNVSSNIFLTGFILLANLDFNDLLQYAVKAAIGGGIWLGYRWAAKFIDRKRDN